MSAIEIKEAHPLVFLLGLPLPSSNAFGGKMTTIPLRRPYGGAK